MAQGFVYVLISNNSEHIKIGLTVKPPFMRIREINQSDNYASHGPWELSDFREVYDCSFVERKMHRMFDDRRAKIDTGAEELFSVAPAEARRALESLEPELLVRQEAADRMFVDKDFALYIGKLFAFTGLPAWLNIQGTWTFSLFPSTGGGRYFTINIGRHEVAFSTLSQGVNKFPTHSIVLDKLIYDFDDVQRWLAERSGHFTEDLYKSALPRATSAFFSCEFSEAEKFFMLPGVRRALIAYWTEALIGLRERGSLSLFAKHHNYNAVAQIVERLRGVEGKYQRAALGIAGGQYPSDETR